MSPEELLLKARIHYFKRHYWPAVMDACSVVIFEVTEVDEGTIEGVKLLSPAIFSSEVAAELEAIVLEYDHERTFEVGAEIVVRLWGDAVLLDAGRPGAVLLPTHPPNAYGGNVFWR